MGNFVLPATVIEFANKGRSTILSDSEVSSTGRSLSGIELYNFCVG